LDCKGGRQCKKSDHHPDKRLKILKPRNLGNGGYRRSPLYERRSKMASITLEITQEETIKLIKDSVQLELIRDFLKKKREENKTYLDIEEIEQLLLKAE